MTTVTSYPGVYIEELPSQSLSIANSPTAVPVFPVARAHDKDNHNAEENPNAAANIANGVPRLLFPKTTRINSWLDFTKALAYQPKVAASLQKTKQNKAVKTIDKPTEATLYDPSNPLHQSVKSYFLNGGGYCYLVPIRSTLSDSVEGAVMVELEDGDFTSRVQRLEDVTLLVEAGVGMPWPAANANSPIGPGGNYLAQDKTIFETAVNLLCIPGNSLFAILDGPQKELTPNTTLDSRTAFTACYYPYLRADWATFQTTLCDIPPSGAVAGAYCRNDRERGVWKAPANVALNGGLVPLFKTSDDLNGQFNPEGLNFIREFTGRGTLIWGARTLTNNTDTEWRYIPVRRLFNSAEKDIKTTMRSMVFEPNNHATWERVRCAIDNYLRSLWRQGALPGKSEKEAYFVLVGKDITMTDDDIAQGKLIVKIGMAAVRPAEFIILQFTQDVNQG
ncbi:phage tail sheath C-terminal domain-containing protein [Chromobacterium sp. Beijing]|uniref:phage tail sheath family protein n=2 Tax=unclassified Chromobacterium TaxID=2641838 RepID=UPI001F2D8284|nr:phage tail sheath C-terminal domain-containing protein [Chromobacterium sp. Beijing]UJB32733.1 phage tail sheath family protein [Chromobacterium sp. Beijing]